ncbi:GNAT family N-acetyltransferase [Paenibacillus lycopersici]|uniref:GNAT family N-acetyltransferase n=1 Tax=Paenibacillus lycopersici TaxID=2704462 RepID=A0A6C0G5A3_9BACL|nr:GNAT family N-acetyltransferase [Paenibacillus lycopersici]QHT60195.1 GNAT family N-acetyltransferase [Paenibacillus lycopersici]
MEIAFDTFVISDNKDKLDHAVIVDYLSRSYWANKRPEERILKSIANSVCYGVYEEGRQVGFARIVTDWATVFYLCDVFILEAYQGRGLGKRLIEAIVNAPEYEGVAGLLGTRDAHGLYERYGFEQIEGRFMRRAPQDAAARTNLGQNESEHAGS